VSGKKVIMKMLLKLSFVTTTLSTVAKNNQSNKSDQCPDHASGPSDDCVSFIVVVIFLPLGTK
jgi:hypothetical protein